MKGLVGVGTENDNQVIWFNFFFFKDVEAVSKEWM